MLKILLVDDDEDEHLFFKWSMEKVGVQAEVLHAFSAHQALGVVTQNTPHLIFLDINLPGADGFECLQEIRKKPLVRDVPVYMFSTSISEETVQRAAILGATGCIKKSRNHEQLATLISNALQPSQQPQHTAK
jgi:CheY-like chemotaxis protein